MPLAQEQALLKACRQVITRHGYNGLRALVKSLQAQASPQGTFDLAAFRSELRRFGVSLTENEWVEVLTASGAQGAPGASLRVFTGAILLTLRGPRLDAVNRAYELLSPDRLSGSLSLDLLLSSYNADGHPWVLEKRTAAKDLLGQFCTMFSRSTNPDGLVSEEEFYAYYAGLSLVTDNDAEFVRTVTGTWKLSGQGRDLETTGTTPLSGTLSKTSLAATFTRSNLASSELVNLSIDGGKQYLRHYLPGPRTTVFLDVSIGNTGKLHRIVIELLYDVAPKTCENFRCLCTGERGTCRRGLPLHYKGTRFHRIVPGLLVQSGDIVANDGSSGESIYGKSFDDECFAVPHDKPGVVSMVNMFGPNTNSSQFFITTAAAAYLNDRNVAFGHVTDGWEALRLIEGCGTEHGVPFEDVIIQDCGQLQ
eukprot:RCo036048